MKVRVIDLVVFLVAVTSIIMMVLLTGCSNIPTQPEALLKKQTSAPTALSGVVINNTVRLFWIDNARGETGYHIRRDGSIIATLPSDSESYINSDLEPAEYCYVVRTYKEKKNVTYGDWSNEVCLTVEVVDPPPPPPPPPPPSNDVFPFGASRYDPSVDYPFNAALYHRVHAGREEEELSYLKTYGAVGSVNLVGGKSNYKNPDESFNVDMWKAVLDEFDVEIIQKYVDEGVIVSHYVLDEPHAGSQWNGESQDPTLVDEAACYSKSKWPNLPVLIRTHPGWAVREGGSVHNFQCVDIWVAQYSARKGPVDEYVAQNIADSEILGTQLAGAINPIGGGDGSSGVVSPYDSNKWMMSAEEIRKYGEAFLNSPITSYGAWYWGWDTSEPMDWYWLQPDIRSANEYLLEIVLTK